jgi:HAD superfamily hydrolase (TIGR01509 family)
MTKKINHFKAIIFDLDGTLIDSMWIWKQIDIDFLKKRHIDFPEDLQKEIEGMSFTETAHYFKNRFKIEESIEAIQEEWHHMAVEFYASRIPLKEDVQHLMAYATANNIVMGIGTSNSKALLETVLEAHQIESHFKTVRTSCEVASGKPSPDIFLKVAEDLNVLPEECLVFEDTYAGVKAGKNAGMTVVAIYDEVSATSSEEIKNIADLYVTSFREFLDYIS